MNRELRDLLKRLEPEVAKAFIEAIESIKSAAQKRTVIEHLEAGNIQAAVQALRLEAAFFGPLDRMLGETYYQGGLAATLALARQRDPFPVAATSLDLTGGTQEPKRGSKNDPAT